MSPQVGFRTRWQDLPPGWRWVLWGIGLGIVAVPVAGESVSQGGLLPAAEMATCGLKTLPCLGAYGLMLAFSRWRPVVASCLVVLWLFLWPSFFVTH